MAPISPLAILGRKRFFCSSEAASMICRRPPIILPTIILPGPGMRRSALPRCTRPLPQSNLHILWERRRPYILFQRSSRRCPRGTPSSISPRHRGHNLFCKLRQLYSQLLLFVCHQGNVHNNVDLLFQALPQKSRKILTPLRRASSMIVGQSGFSHFPFLPFLVLRPCPALG